MALMVVMSLVSICNGLDDFEVRVIHDDLDDWCVHNGPHNDRIYDCLIGCEVHGVLIA